MSFDGSVVPDEIVALCECVPLPMILLDAGLRPLWMNASAGGRGAARLDEGLDVLLGRLVTDASRRERLLRELQRRAAGADGRDEDESLGVRIARPRPGLISIVLDTASGESGGSAQVTDGFRQLLEAGPDVYAHFDRRARLCHVNAGVHALCGWTADELEGVPLGRLVSDRSRAALGAALPALLADGHLENIEVEVPRADGGMATTLVQVALSRSPRGRPRGAVAVVRDITRRKLLQERLLEADRLAATGKLAARVAHEINNPLQALVMHMSIVGPEIPPDVEIVDSWERMRDAARQIQRIVSDLLDLPEGHEDGEGWADLNDAIRETLGLARKALSLRRIRVRAELDDALPSVPVRRRHLRQIALNLVLNSLDTMSQGGLLTLRTSGRAQGKSVFFDVRDSGPPIPEERLARLFDPHPRHGELGENGLGLFVVHHLVRAAGGRISVDSSPGRGTLFRVTLPVYGRNRTP